MEGAAHTAQSSVGVDQHRFRCLEGLAGLQAPAEIRGIDAHEHPGTALGVHFHLNGEVAAIDQIQAPHFALFFGGGVLGQCQHGVGAVAGHTPQGLQALDPLLQGVAHGGVLLVPLAVDVDHVQVHGGQLQAGAVGPLQSEGGGAGVLQANALGHDGIVLEYGVEQGGFQSGDGVHSVHFQGLGLAFSVKGGGQAGQSGLAIVDPVGNIPHIRDGIPVAVSGGEGSNAVISGAVGGVFHRGNVRGEEGVLYLGIGGIERGKGSPKHQVGEVRVGDFGAAVQVDQIPLLIDHEGVSGEGGVQLEQTVFRIIGNRHKEELLSKRIDQQVETSLSYHRRRDYTTRFLVGNPLV